jgi:hypothetical protein
MLNVVSLYPFGLEYRPPPFTGSNLTAESSLTRALLWTPRISTNAETGCPSAFLIVQPGPPGPGDTHPDGVFGPAVSQRLASPGLGARIPGLKMLPPSIAPPDVEFF